MALLFHPPWLIIIKIFGEENTWYSPGNCYVVHLRFKYFPQFLFPNILSVCFYLGHTESRLRLQYRCLFFSNQVPRALPELRILIAVWAQGSPCGIYGGKMALALAFTGVLWFCPASKIPLLHIHSWETMKQWCRDRRNVPYEGERRTRWLSTFLAEITIAK
jgi:hypothetical protein